MYNGEDRNCPICGKYITSEICYEVVMCLTAGYNSNSVPEVVFENNEKTKDICDNCPYSDLS